jgi:hypothetical protein
MAFAVNLVLTIAVLCALIALYLCVLCVAMTQSSDLFDDCAVDASNVQSLDGPDTKPVDFSDSTAVIRSDASTAVIRTTLSRRR